MSAKSIHKNFSLWPRRLSVQIVLLFSLLVGSSMLVFIVHGISEQAENRSESLKLQTQVLARNLAATSAIYLLSRDYVSVEESLMRSALFPGIMEIQVCDADGKILGDVIHLDGDEPLARYDLDPLTPPTQQVESVTIANNTLIVWQPMVLGELLGWVKVRYNLSQISEEITYIWGKNSIVGLIILIIAAVVLTLLTRRPIAEIHEYTEFADRLDECSGEQVPVFDSSLELHTLGAAINRASLRLKEQTIVIRHAMADMERMAAAAEHAPNVILTIDQEYNINYINPYGYRLISDFNIEEQQIKMLLPIDFENLISTTIREQVTLRELEVFYKGRTLLWTFAPVINQPAAHAYGIDITESKLAKEGERAALIEKLSAESANKSKSIFLANMSHELRTPLNAIIGYSEILSEDVIAAAHDCYSVDITKIQTAGRHLLALINEILDLSKIEAGRMKLYIEKINLDILINEVVSTTEPPIKRNGNRLTIDRSDNLGIVKSDITKLRQILINLISNAGKFSQNSEIAVLINRVTERDGDWIIFEVKDSGIGMTSEQLNRIFEPFAQADDSTTRSYGGTGLGLAITKSFCEMLEGDIEANSVENVGSTFTVRIPAMVKAPSIDEQFLTEDIEPKEQRQIQESNENERRQLITEILIIDDDPVTRNELTQNLSNNGFIVETATNRQQGLSIAKAIKPRIIVLDVMVSGMEGWSILKSIKADPSLKDIPVVILSQVDEISLGFSLGADDYLLKPINLQSLESTIKKWIRKNGAELALLLMQQSPLLNLIRSSIEIKNCPVSAAESSFIAVQSAEKITPSVIIIDYCHNEIEARKLLEAQPTNEQLCHADVLVLIEKAQISQANDLISHSMHRIIIDNTFDDEQIKDNVISFLQSHRKRIKAA